jgi:hypothetical protein
MAEPHSISTTPVSSHLRMIAAAIAAAIAISICIAQRHVRVVLAEPHNYASPLRHKCGLLMIGCVIWAMLELRRYLYGRNPAAYQ